MGVAQRATPIQSVKEHRLKMTVLFVFGKSVGKGLVCANKIKQKETLFNLGRKKTQK